MIGGKSLASFNFIQSVKSKTNVELFAVVLSVVLITHVLIGQFNYLCQL